ncbi:hypothetical protein [Hymenobacter ruber]
MTEYTLDYQYSMDITWFFLGNDGYISTFNSGGAIVPEIISNDAKANQILIEYFDNLTPFSDVTINPFLDKYFDVKSLRSPLSQYSYYAQRGLISFDKINPGPGQSDINYHLIAYPVNKLNVDALPEEIKSILLRTKQPISFKDFYKIDEGYIPWASLFKDFYVPTSLEQTTSKRKRWFDFLWF